MTNIPYIKRHAPRKLNADLSAEERSPEFETRFLGFQVFVVDEGCTLEIEIVEASGQVTRLHTTDNPANDHRQIGSSIALALSRLMENFNI